MKKIYILLGLAIIASIALNIFFLCGKGIAITNHYQQNQNQQQAQVVINGTANSGYLTWKSARVKNPDEFLSTLAQEQALFAKIDNGRVFYPVFSTTDPLIDNEKNLTRRSERDAPNNPSSN